MKKITLLPMAVALLISLANAQEPSARLVVSVEIPRLAVAEYHRPYVAMWLEEQRSGTITDLAVWYDIALRDSGGQEWLKDIRQWWRRSGRELSFPIDGVTGATRAPGLHDVEFGSPERPLPDMPPGEYRLTVEAAREVGGRELVTLSFDWPITEPQTLTAGGDTELGRVSLRLVP